MTYCILPLSLCDITCSPFVSRVCASVSLFVYRPYFWNSQSLLSRGQTDLAFSHREMQWKWKAC